MLKALFRNVFAFLLTPLEAGEEPYHYKPSHRVALVILGLMFLGLALLVLWFVPGQDPGYFLPVLVFAAIAVVSLAVGLLGSDRAVARIWRSSRS